jgi:hypothetical protein
MDFLKYSLRLHSRSGSIVPSRTKIGGVPPSLYPRKALLGAGGANMGCKILISKSLEVKILRTKHLGRFDVLSAHRHGLGHHCRL